VTVNFMTAKNSQAASTGRGDELDGPTSRSRPARDQQLQRRAIGGETPRRTPPRAVAVPACRASGPSPPQCCQYIVQAGAVHFRHGRQSLVQNLERGQHVRREVLWRPALGSYPFTSSRRNGCPRHLLEVLARSLLGFQPGPAGRPLGTPRPCAGCQPALPRRSGPVEAQQERARPSRDGGGQPFLLRDVKGYEPQAAAKKPHGGRAGPAQGLAREIGGHAGVGPRRPCTSIEQHCGGLGLKLGKLAQPLRVAVSRRGVSRLSTRR